MECSRELILVDLCPESHAYFILCFLVIGPVSRVPQSLSDVTAVLIVYLLSLPTLLSTLCLVETCSCLVPDNVSGTEHSASPVLQRGTVCHPTFAPHQWPRLISDVGLELRGNINKLLLIVVMCCILLLHILWSGLQVSQIGFCLTASISLW